MHTDFTAVIIVAIVIVNVFYVNKRSRDLLADWAGRNGLTLVEANWSFFWPASWWLTTSRNQTVYRITVRNYAGQMRTGWARCGGWFVGLWSDNVDVYWDDADVHWN